MDLYYKKEISYKFSGHMLRFNAGITLFSTFDIDHGTDVLLRHIDIKPPKSILDIGCGCGIIGICLAKKYPKASVTCVDRDLLAVKYTNDNVVKNELENCKAIGSIGMEAVGDEKFDLIVSNVPAKIGDEAITHDFILTPLEHLNPGGTLWIVVVTALNRLIPKVGRTYDLKMREVKKRTGHSVYCIQKKS
jgi:16S rRNA (guanine1207-N2)-methyltransferase